MHATILILRLLHIGSGVFWAGAMFFFWIFLEPSVRALGPDGMRVMRELQARRYVETMPVLALITILTGLELLRRTFPGGPAMWIATPSGRTFVIGASSAIIAFLIGIIVVLPAMKRVGMLGGQIGSLPEGPAKAAMAAELGALRVRMTTLGRLVASLLGITVAAMATARYM
jgi:uncharacterized membrane protein